MACILENYNTYDALCYPLFGRNRFAKFGKFTCFGRVTKSLDCSVILRTNRKMYLILKTTLFQGQHLVMTGFLYEAKEDSNLLFHLTSFCLRFVSLISN